MSGPVLGAILAGGRSRRFGAPKALAEVGGRTIARRVRDALTRALPEVVLIANEPALFLDLHLPTRPDAIPGGGPLSGVHAALEWARERGRSGALCVACDLPFVEPALLEALARRAGESGAPIVAPEGPGSEGEPLCAVYSVACLPEIEARLARGERGMKRLLEAARAELLPLAELRRWGDPEVLFLNVNTPGEHRRAEQIARERDEGHGF